MPKETEVNTNEILAKQIANEILADLIGLFSKAHCIPKAKQQALLKALKHPGTSLSKSDIASLHTFLHLALHDLYKKSSARNAIDDKLEDIFNRYIIKSSNTLTPKR
jgi:hypothetical protein